MLRDGEYTWPLPARPGVANEHAIKIDVLHGPMCARKLEVARDIEVRSVRVDGAVQERGDIEIVGIFDGNLRSCHPRAGDRSHIGELVVHAFLHEDAGSLVSLSSKTLSPSLKAAVISGSVCSKRRPALTVSWPLPQGEYCISRLNKYPPKPNLAEHHDRRRGT